MKITPTLLNYKQNIMSQTFKAKDNIVPFPVPKNPDTIIDLNSATYDSFNPSKITLENLDAQYGGIEFLDEDALSGREVINIFNGINKLHSLVCEDMEAQNLSLMLAGIAIINSESIEPTQEILDLLDLSETGKSTASINEQMRQDIEDETAKKLGSLLDKIKMDKHVLLDTIRTSVEVIKASFDSIFEIIRTNICLRQIIDRLMKMSQTSGIPLPEEAYRELLNVEKIDQK